jgi:acetyltransferase-like isoleucine patch superfamily enzyme
MNRNPVYAQDEIGDYTYGAPTVVRGCGHLKIGKFCSIGGGTVIVLGGEHRSDWVTTYPFYELFPAFESYSSQVTEGDVTIGSDVWIGRNVLILSGVTVCDGAVIGGGSVVTKDVLPYSIVGGNPARLIRMRFEAPIIVELLKVKWWDWPVGRVCLYMHALLSPPYLGGLL